MWYEYVLSMYLATVLVGWYTIVWKAQIKADTSRAILAIAWAIVSILLPISTICAVFLPHKMLQEYNLVD